MNRHHLSMDRSSTASRLRIVGDGLDAPGPVTPPDNTVIWLINGYEALTHVWTAAEWDALPHKPADAQLCPNGTRIALRIA